MTQRRPRRPARIRHPRRRLAIATWLAAYPTITAILAAFKPLGLTDAPLPVRTLVLTLIAVPLMVFVLTPALQRALGRLLRGSRQPRPASRARGRGGLSVGDKSDSEVSRVG
jgi:antibiotic biosynthesis monooxygenase (ABM) superfamily enzyme